MANNFKASMREAGIKMNKKRLLIRIECLKRLIL